MVFLLHINTVLNFLEVGSLLPKHVAICNLTVIITSFLAVFCVLTVHNI